MIYNSKIEINPAEQPLKYDLIDSHLHFLDFVQDSDGFPALAKAMDIAGVSEAVVFGIPMAKKWTYYMKNRPAFRMIYDLAADYDLPVLVHHNISPQNAPAPIYKEELVRALEHNRNCKIIWAHVGVSRRIEIEELLIIAGQLLHNNPNLYVDISWIFFENYVRGHLSTGNEEQEDAYTEMWAALIEKYPDRFMIGSDAVGHWASYPATIQKYYLLLDKLKPESVEKICRANILSLIKKWD